MCVQFQPTGLAGLSSYEAALNKDGAKFPGDKMTNSTQQRRGIQTHPDGELKGDFSPRDLNLTRHLPQNLPC